MEKDKREEKTALALPHFTLTADDPCAVQGLKAYRRLLSDQEQVRAVGEVIKDFQKFLESKEKSATEIAETAENTE